MYSIHNLLNITENPHIKDISIIFLQNSIQLQIKHWMQDVEM